MPYLILETNFSYCLTIKSSETSFDTTNYTMPPLHFFSRLGYWLIDDSKSKK